MRKNKSVFFVALVLWTGIFFMAACGGNGVDDGDGTPPPSAPSAPTIEEIYSENRELAILWDVVNNTNTYNLYWNTSGGVTTSDSSVTSLRAPYYVHTGLSLFKTYSYAVTAVNAGGASGLSNEMSALAAGVPEELWKRIAADAQNGDNLGYSVAVSGDYAVAGAFSEDGGGTNRGAVYVFERNYGGNDNWGQMAKLVASDDDDSFYFGFSVALSGDYVVVGAFLEDGLGTDRGAAYVFYRNQGGTDNWGQVAKLTASDADDSDQFGHSVAIGGDNVVVGAHYEDGLGTNRGAAYVYGRNQGGADNWGQVTKLTASNPENAAYFGYSVAVRGDFAVVGAYGEDGTGTNLGAAYIFDRNFGGSDSWGQVTKLMASDAEDIDEFGTSVAIDGDYVVVGAYLEDGAGTSLGAAYVFYRNSPNPDDWGEVMKLTASDAEDQDWFGYSVAISGDYAVVSAAYEDDAGTNAGALYIF